MDELGLSVETAKTWFEENQQSALLLVTVGGKQSLLWPSQLAEAVRRAYIADSHVTANAAKHGVSNSDIIATKLPDPGSVMAGDFGEILVYIYHATSSLPKKLIGPKKWRLKQDRTKPAPHSDVVHFFMPQWPTASDKDIVLCSEVKTKSTNSQFDPISAAIEGSTRDRVSRLSRTLVWLRERALTESLGTIQIAQINRFINATEFPPSTWKYFAVAVICSSLAQKEIEAVSASCPANMSLLVLVVPNLKATYTAVFEAAAASTVVAAQ